MKPRSDGLRDLAVILLVVLVLALLAYGLAREVRVFQ